MDTDWCLTCNTHLDASAASYPYCSPDCRCMAGPSRLSEGYQPSDSASFNDSEDVVYHDVQEAPSSHYTGNDYDGIFAWAAAVVPGPPAHERSRPPSMRSESSSRSSISTSSRKSLATVICRPPELLRKHRPLAPTLCMSTTKLTRASPSQPIGTLQPIIQSTLSAAYSTSTGQTDSSLATPASVNAMPFSDTLPKGTVLDSIRSWIAPSPLRSTPHSPVDYTRFCPPFTSKPEPQPKSSQNQSDYPSLKVRGRKSLPVYA